MLTFIIWSWKGWQGNMYKARHVNAFCRMLHANVTLPHKIVCITDDPTDIDQTLCETYPLWEEFKGLTSSGKPNCFRRLKMFQRDFAKQFGSRLVSMDLDCVILQNIDSLFEDKVQFKILEGRSCKYNGSLWMLTPGVHPEVWDKFDPIRSPQIIVARRKKTDAMQDKLVGSDQAWMSIMIKDAATWKLGFDQAICSYVLHNSRGKIHPANKIVFFAGGTKPWDKAVRAQNGKLFEEYGKYDH